MRALRERAELSQEQVAELVEVDRKTVSRAENGWYPYNIDFVIRMAHAFRVPLHWLFTDDWHIETCSDRPETDRRT